MRCGHRQAEEFRSTASRHCCSLSSTRMSLAHHCHRQSNWAKSCVLAFQRRATWAYATGWETVCLETCTEEAACGMNIRRLKDFGPAVNQLQSRHFWMMHQRASSHTDQCPLIPGSLRCSTTRPAMPARFTRYEWEAPCEVRLNDSDKVLILAPLHHSACDLDTRQAMHKLHPE